MGEQPAPQPAKAERATAPAPAERASSERAGSERTTAERATSPAPHPGPEAHIVTELGMDLTVDGDAIVGRAAVVPEMLVPGTDELRTSVLAVWVDLVAGILTGVTIAPRVPVTLDLDVHCYRAATIGQQVQAVARAHKVGRSVTVVGVDLSVSSGAGDGRPLAVATASFMASPDATLELPPLSESLVLNHGGGRLRLPLAERARCRRIAPGVAELPRSEDTINASNTVNGGLIALACEEAVLSALEPGVGGAGALASLAVRYLRPARVGPVVARAEVHGGVGRVVARDAGSEDRVAVVATTRTFPPGA